MIPYRVTVVVASFAFAWCAALAWQPASSFPDPQGAIGPVDWVSLDGTRMAFGSGGNVTIATRGLPGTSLVLDAPVADGVLYFDRLYLDQVGGRLVVLDLARPDAGVVPLTVASVFAGAVRTSRMGEHLIVLEDGFGLRLFELPPPAAHAMHGATQRGAADVTAAGVLEIPASFSAVGASGTTIVAATADGRLIVVDAGRPDAPRVARTLDLGFPIDAVGANGSRVYLLHEGGLGVLDLGGDEAPVVRGTDGAARGRALAVAGRRLYVGGDGVAVVTDATEAAVIVPVNVSNFSFTPSTVMIHVGDTVKWTNTAGLHSVESCDGVADPVQCTGVAAEGFFTSGAAAFNPWTYSKTFTVPGGNPYFCVVHVSSNMKGAVTVAPPPPPGTPDGTVGTDPLIVAKAPVGGFPDRLALSWDAASCTGDADYELLVGGDVDLPASFSGTYGLLTQVCSIGTTGSFVWTTPPAPAAGRFDWFLIVANDGVNVEGSWGRNSGAIERKGPGGPGGSSGTCRLLKDLTNTCGQ